ncbi:MAG: DUF4105 domain-containing protein [Pseudomonadota bacterium]
MVERIVMIVSGALAAAVLAGGLFLQTKAPRTDRLWADGFTRTPQFETQGEGVYALKDLRAFVFDENGPAERAWRDVTLDAAALESVWFFIEPFPANDLFAHSFLSFVFRGPGGTRDAVSISVEARKEAGETYSALRGVLREYELLYIWSTEKDILTRIAIDLDHPLRAYELAISPAQGRAIFEHFVQRTNDLAERPRFYNTWGSNCTNELAKAVNDAFPGALPWRPVWVLTGRSAQWLHGAGFIEPAETPFADVQAAADIREKVQSLRARPPSAFSAAWRGVEN